MGVYTSVFWHGLRRYATYRAATAAGILTNSVFGCVSAFVLIAVWEARPGLAGWDAADAVAFVFVAQALIGVVAPFGPSLEIGERIRTGDVAIDLIRPVALPAWWLAQDLGRAAFGAVFRGVPTFAVGALLFTLTLPDGPAQWLAFAAATLLAALVGFGLRYLYALSAFWVVDDRGVQAVAWLVGPFFSGMFLPLALFPEPLGAVLRALPWSAMVQVPAEVFLGDHTGAGLAAALGFQAAWAAALLLAGRALTATAVRRVVVQGG
ncbi:ABC transporter permease [Allonocardiopsis opalescens]|uniref:ABC-2 type transport system permease protein n=1 Tax=Allonocardiopsis opalescens TaxID=1144618 RepID=A0A2T0Q4K0_9ACTN|nr:ABC-2 family transporter protein [Allonocardiopsis opalescens]PRX98710.1 ABC-2 type transport system permease protein [Allonocardiopsis opalescens]